MRTFWHSKRIERKCKSPLITTTKQSIGNPTQMLLSWFGRMPYAPHEIGQGFVATIQGDGEGLNPHNIALM